MRRHILPDTRTQDVSQSRGPFSLSVILNVGRHTPPVSVGILRDRNHDDESSSRQGMESILPDIRGDQIPDGKARVVRS